MGTRSFIKYFQSFASPLQFKPEHSEYVLLSFTLSFLIETTACKNPENVIKNENVLKVSAHHLNAIAQKEIKTTSLVSKHCWLTRVQTLTPGY